MDTLKYILNKYKVENSRSPVNLWCSREITFPRLIRRLNFTLGAEIGVARGLFSKILCQGNPNLKLYSVDAWESYVDYSCPYEQKKMDQMYKYAKSRLAPYNCQFIKDRSISAVKRFADRSLDFVYIDANHNYEFVKEDIREWSKKVRKGGIIAGHDYHNGTYGDMGGAQTDYGVKRAVDEWIEQNRIQYLFVLAKGKVPSWFYVKV